MKTSLSREAFLNRLAETTPFESEGELENWVKRNESDIRRKQKKAAANGDADAEADLVEDETPTFPLVDRPDSELTEEEIKEKRKQRLMKAGWEARLKLKEEKRKEKERQASDLASPRSRKLTCSGRGTAQGGEIQGDGTRRMVCQAASRAGCKACPELRRDGADVAGCH